MPSLNFVDFIHRASRICLGQSTKALVWRWTQICPLKINIFTLSAASSTNEVSMFKLAIEVCFENNFGLIHAIFLSLGSTKSGYFFGTPGIFIQSCDDVVVSFFFFLSLPNTLLDMGFWEAHKGENEKGLGIPQRRPSTICTCVESMQHGGTLDNSRGVHIG